MRHRVQRPSDASPERIRALLHDPSRWPDWLAGVALPDDVGSLPASVPLVLAAPRPVRATLHVEQTEDGIRYTLVEGELAAVTGRIGVRGEGSGAVVDWEQEIEPVVTVGGAFAAEITRVLERWAAELVRQAS